MEYTNTNKRNSTENKNLGCRCITFEGIRAVEGTERTYILSFSSEEPYERWFGTEILDHSPDAVNLERLNTIGVLLFNHDTFRVCGKIKRAWIENNRGQAEVEFDTDDEAEIVHQKVKNGTLKSTSVRYSVEVWEEVASGKKSTNGKYTGPCSIAAQWTPLEISIVSVPADATVGVGRSIDEESVFAGKSMSITDCYRKISENLSI